MIIASDPFPHGGLMRILFSQVPSTDTWPLYKQWAYKTEDTTDGNPDAPKQTDFHNCGVFTVTSAFNLTFGYDMMCYDQHHLEGKRRRMVMELYSGGLGGKYAYHLLDIPDGPALNPQITEPNTAKIPYSRSLDTYDTKMVDNSDAAVAVQQTIESAKQEPDDPTNRLFDPSPSYREPMDLDESRGMAEDFILERQAAQGNSALPFDSYSSPLGSEAVEQGPRGRRLSRLIPSAERAIWMDFVRHLPKMHRAWDTGREYVRRTEMELRAYPPQFDPKHFQKVGFLYPSLPGMSGHEILSRYTIDERKTAYANFPIEEIEEWEHESPEIIDRWAQNQMAAFVAQHWDETVKPEEELTRI